MFIAPGVGVVDDAAGFVGGDGVALHDPFDGRFAVDDVLVGFEGDIAQDGSAVVDDDIFDAFLREAHFVLEAEVAFALLCQRVWLDGFIVEVKSG